MPESLSVSINPQILPKKNKWTNSFCVETNIEMEKIGSRVDTKEILFGNEIDSDINDFVAREREALTQEGFLVISGMINLKEREIYGDTEIATSGFLPEFGQEEEIKSIKEEFKEIVNTHLKMRKVDYKDLRQELKNSLSKKILKDTKKRPILIPIIIDISGSNQQIDTD